MFFAFKHIHMLMAILTVVFLITRFALGMRSAGHLNKKWLKISPHVVDFLLVISIIGMLSSTGLTPFDMAWTTEKLIVFVAYIVLSVLMMLSLRGRLSTALRVPTFVLALLSWVWLIKVATTKSPMLFG